MKSRYSIHTTSCVHMLTATTQGLAWRSFSICRTTFRSVFIDTPVGEVQLPRRELEWHGRVEVGGEVFAVHRFALPRDAPPRSS